MGVRRFLSADSIFQWGPEQISADFAKKMVSNSGEEIARPTEPTVEQVIPGLPRRGAWRKKSSNRLGRRKDTLVSREPPGLRPSRRRTRVA